MLNYISCLSNQSLHFLYKKPKHEKTKCVGKKYYNVLYFMHITCKIYDNFSQKKQQKQSCNDYREEGCSFSLFSFLVETLADNTQQVTWKYPFHRL